MKLFTIQEANALLPSVRTIVAMKPVKRLNPLKKVVAAFPRVWTMQKH
jgi:hypothetical protein